MKKEKAAWELGVQPYKCDNSRLLNECNNLQLEILKQRDKFVLTNAELKSKVRTLQTDKKQLQDNLSSLEARMRELEIDGKMKKDGANLRKYLNYFNLFLNANYIFFR